MVHLAGAIAKKDGAGALDLSNPHWPLESKMHGVLARVAKNAI